MTASQVPTDVPRLPPLAGDVPAAHLPQWNLRRLVHRICPACRADQPEPWCVRPDGVAVSRCGGCGMFYLCGLPAAEEIAALYEDYGRFKSYQPAKFPKRMARRLAAEHPLIQILRRSGGLDGKQLLEIGCSHGHFLQLAKSAGAMPTGLEPDRRSAEFVRGLGLPIADAIPSAPAFDIVCAFEVIEHLADPDGWAAEVARALRPGGRLLLAMPNGGEAARVGPHWIGFRVDLEHFNYFSSATLARLLARHGLHLEQDWLSGQPHLHAPSRPPLRARALERLRTALGVATRAPLSPRPDEGSYALIALARRV